MNSIWELISYLVSIFKSIYILVSLTLIGIYLTVYYYINRSGKSHFNYYWKGFLLISLGNVIYITSRYFGFEGYIMMIVAMMSTALIVAGFYLVLIVGYRKQLKYKQGLQGRS